MRCNECRDRLETLRDSQAVLLAASNIDPVSPDSASLWPDLARRLRQARRPRLRTAWGFEPRWDQRSWAWSLGGLAAGLLVAASLVGLGARHDRRIKEIVDAYVPIAPLLSSEQPRLLKPEDPEAFEQTHPGQARLLLPRGPRLRGSRRRRAIFLTPTDQRDRVSHSGGTHPLIARFDAEDSVLRWVWPAC